MSLNCALGVGIVGVLHRPEGAFTELRTICTTCLISMFCVKCITVDSLLHPYAVCSQLLLLFPLPPFPPLPRLSLPPVLPCIPHSEQANGYVSNTSMPRSRSEMSSMSDKGAGNKMARKSSAISLHAGVCVCVCMCVCVCVRACVCACMCVCVTCLLCNNLKNV